jgi:hypothetical protein
MRVPALERPAGRRRIAHLLPLRGSLARRGRTFVVLIRLFLSTINGSNLHRRRCCAGSDYCEPDVLAAALRASRRSAIESVKNSAMHHKGAYLLGHPCWQARTHRYDFF